MEDKSKRKNSEALGEQLMEGVQDLVHKGNIRHLVIKSSSGATLIDTSLTVAALVTAFAIVFLPFIPVALAIVLIAIIAKVRVEIVREITNEDTMVMSHLSDDEEDATTVEPDTSRISTEAKEAGQ